MLFQVFSQTSMEEISRKQFLLTGYLEVLLKMNFSKHSASHYQQNDNHCSNNSSDSDSENSNVLNDLPSIQILTPSDPNQRGSQLSISFSIPLCAVQEELKKNGIVVRTPGICCLFLHYPCLQHPLSLFPRALSDE
jgi:kynureninase